jgi:hypothetical protein
MEFCLALRVLIVFAKRRPHAVALTNAFWGTFSKGKCAPKSWYPRPAPIIHGNQLVGDIRDSMYNYCTTLASGQGGSTWHDTVLHPAMVADAMLKSHPWRTEFEFGMV